MRLISYCLKCKVFKFCNLIDFNGKHIFKGNEDSKLPHELLFDMYVCTWCGYKITGLKFFLFPCKLGNSERCVVLACVLPAFTVTISRPCGKQFGSSLCLKWIVFLFSAGIMLTFKYRIKSHLPFAGIIRSSPYSPHFQDKG